MNSRPVWTRGKFEALGSHGPWIGLGMVIVLIVWLKLLTTAGELIQRDLEYPLFASDVLGDFYPMLASDGRICKQRTVLRSGLRTWDNVYGARSHGQRFYFFIFVYFFFANSHIQIFYETYLFSYITLKSSFSVKK